VFRTLGTIPSEFWYIWFNFGTLYVWYTSWYTVLVSFCWYSKQLFGTLESSSVILGTIVTVVTFGTSVGELLYILHCKVIAQSTAEV